jgi:CheY-like chemotaxis protein
VQDLSDYYPCVAQNQLNATQPAARRRLRILVADDERDMVATLSAILQDEGHEVREVYLGSEVLRLAQAFDPDVALIDIGMPGMSGYDVARELREAFGKARPLLIAVTGWKMSSDRILAKLAGFDHHLAKPFDPQALLRLLEAAPGNDRT